MLNGAPMAAQPEKGDEALAAAVLMVEVAAGDGQISRVERERILSLLENRLGLSAEEALELFVEAIATADFSVDFEDLSLPPEIKRALILHNGKLTPDFQYINKYL